MKPPQRRPQHGYGSNFARERLRDAILSGELAAGSVMTQTELGDTLGIGRTPLREAIRVVQEEGLLDPQPNRKIRVASFSADDLEQLYVLRIIHEAAAIQATVPSLTSEEIGELRALVAKMDHFAALQDFERFAVPHRAFHALLIARQGERAAALASQLFDHAERYRRAYLMSGPWPYEMAHQEHHRILEAAVEGDAMRCTSELTAHYARTAAGVVVQLDRHHDLAGMEFACAVALGEPDRQKGAALWQRALDQHGGLTT